MIKLPIMKKLIIIFVAIVSLFAASSLSSAETSTTTTTSNTTTTTGEVTTTTTTTTVPETDNSQAPETIVKLAETSYMDIVQTTDNIQGTCLPSILSLSNKVSSSETEFVLTVIASAPLCEPVRATAAVYAMPANGVAWPQTLVEATPFTIFEAGTTVITFYKSNTCVQFDVITGYAPQTISPLGPWHGPLLFPFDLATAEQYWGCPPEPVPVELAPSTNLEFTG
jgi:hypothetical protein